MVKIAQLRRYTPGQLVAIKIETFQACKVPQRGRYIPGQSVVSEVQIGNSAYGTSIESRCGYSLGLSRISVYVKRRVVSAESLSLCL